MFMIASLKVGNRPCLMDELKDEIKGKIEYGVRNGYIKRYLGVVPVDMGQFKGFYVKAIDNRGAVEISGGFQIEKPGNIVIQTTLMCPKTWNEAQATDTFSDIIRSLRLKAIQNP